MIGKYNPGFYKLRFLLSRYTAAFRLFFRVLVSNQVASCSTRRMVETAAHMVNNVLPPVQFRQWALQKSNRKLPPELGESKSSVSCQTNRQKTPPLKEQRGPNHQPIG